MVVSSSEGVSANRKGIGIVETLMADISVHNFGHSKLDPQKDVFELILPP
jgi:hypothetical protein